MAHEILKNPLFAQGLSDETGLAYGSLQEDAQAALALYRHCPVAHDTPLVKYDGLAHEWGVGSLFLKMESQRMGLGSFKALGAAHAIAKWAAQKGDVRDQKAMATALKGETLICASAGNHGLSLAAGARLFGARAVVLLAKTVPEEFAERLRQKGADVMRVGDNYEQSMAASIAMAEENGWFLLSDGTWQGYSDPAKDVMEGYLIMGHEVADQIEQAPTHVFLQAGVGGLAAACAAAARNRWGQDVCLIVVEPDAAPALIESVREGRCVDTKGSVSSMGRLDCKTPSHLALKYLAREANFFTTLSDAAVEETVEKLKTHGVETTPSGGAGLAALHHFYGKNQALYNKNQERANPLGLDEKSRILCIVSEGAA